MTSVRTLLTAEEFLMLPGPGDGRRQELLDGEIVEMTPPGAQHGQVMTNIAFWLASYVRAHDRGAVLSGDPGIVLRRNPDRVRAPDVCYIARARVPAEGLPPGYLNVIPDLIVEVISPGDAAAEVQEKTVEWLQAGARLVWTVYPATRSVVVSRSLSDIRVLTAADTLDGAPVWPDFACPVADLFA